MKNILLVLFFAFSLVSCSKDDPEAENAPPMQNLTGNSEKKWRLSFAEAKAGTASANLISNYPCWGDNILTLKADGSYVFEDAGEKCQMTNGETTIAAWVLTENPLTIKLDRINIAGLAELENLSLNITENKSNTFTGVVKNITFGGFSVDTVTLTFVEVK
jgi:hypothetical protein